ncbi:TMEM175 family protein [Massilia sp. R2A-15]|uniref:TMEM175 family protein n=1 Tax=Massilia sp. R2A-15 TaxID=3064278 RepID=UPI0035A704D9
MFFHSENSASCAAAAFSDGVIAIVTTIMVIELKVPHGASLNDLLAVLPVLGNYVLQHHLRGYLLEQAPACKLPLIPNMDPT